MLNLFSTLILCILLLSFGSCGGNKEESTNDNQANTNNQEVEQNNAKSIEQPAERAIQAFKTIQSYFEGLTKGEYQKAAKSFAPQVKKWITMDNTNPKAIAKEAARFLSSKENVKYTLNVPSFNFVENKATVIVSQDWEGYHATLEVLLEFDEDANIISYKEGQILDLKKQTADASTLAKLLKNSSKWTLPIKIKSVEFDDYKKMSAQDLAFLNLKPYSDGMYQETYNHLGYFSFGESKVGLIYAYIYRSSVIYFLTIFDKNTGEIIANESIGSAGGGHVMFGYNSHCETSISTEGKIKVYGESGTINPETSKFTIENSGTTTWQITATGNIKLL